MAFEYVRDYYGVPAKKDMRVAVDRKPGVITGDGGQYINVRLDGQKHSEPCHPTWRVTYYGPNGEVLAQYGD